MSGDGSGAKVVSPSFSTYICVYEAYTFCVWLSSILSMYTRSAPFSLKNTTMGREEEGVEMYCGLAPGLKPLGLPDGTSIHLEDKVQG